MSDGQPGVDLVVVLFRSARHVPALAEGLEGQTYPRERVRLWLVANGPDDGALASLKERFASWPGGLEVIELETNEGFAAGNNAAIQRGRHPYVLVLNADTRMAPHCLGRLVVRAEVEKDAGIVEARQSPYEHPKPFGRATGETSFACFGGALLRREALQEAGLMDPWFFMYLEDVDLSWRLWARGWRCLYEPEAVYEHFTGAPEEHSSPHLVFYSYRNAVALRRLYGSALRAWGWAALWYARSVLSPTLRGERGEPLRKGLRDAWRQRGVLRGLAGGDRGPGWWVGFRNHQYGPGKIAR